MYRQKNNMTNNYYRITAYHKSEDLGVIMDSFGLYEKLWQLSSFFIQKGFEVLEIANADKFLDGNIKKTDAVPDNLILRAITTGRPEKTVFVANLTTYEAIQVGDKAYIPDRQRMVGND